jgi:hypothetical protein
MDFTLRKYTELLHSLIDNHYRFIKFEEYCSLKEELVNDSIVILRHDVDLKAENSLATAEIEHSLCIKASYYFRVVEQSNRPEIIKAIAALGHEIGYHYEDMAICGGDTEKAILHFEEQLEYLRRYYPVKTICMHGSPRSKYDGKDLWKSYDYHDFEIIGEPYFDVDFSKLFYLTDTGRRWDGFNVSLRDKVPVFQDEWIRQGLVYRTTDDIIDAVKGGKLPRQLMMTTHPQRWTENRWQWTKECVAQSVKNVVKRMIVKQNG